MKFSQRINKNPVSEVIQKEDMSIELRNNLWNMLYMHIQKDYDNEFTYQLQKWLYIRLYKRPIDEIIRSKSISFLKNKILSDTWFDVYDLLEEISSFLGKHYFSFINQEQFIEFCNAIFINECSAYRFVDCIITPITSDIEIDEIELAINGSSQKGIEAHLQKALLLMSNKEHPDYRNSIKESISAVEFVCRDITGESTLDKALLKLKNKKIVIPSMLEDGMKKIYYFTNSEVGIRHALMDESVNIDFAEAKYMLVICSAFINYLKEKLVRIIN